METGCDDVRAVDTGLVLGLGYGSRSCSGDDDAAKRRVLDDLKPKARSSTLDGSDEWKTDTCLTLGRQVFLAGDVGVKRRPAGEPQVFSGNGQHHPSSPQSQSMASSLSNSLPSADIKRERDADRAMSSRASCDEDVDEASAKKKLRLTKEQSALLEERFKEHSTLNPKQKIALAKQLNLRPRQVEVWFQNRRARTKLKQTEVDCEVLKRCCESLTDENRRLQMELQQLRALKLATPMYMHIPGAATLTLCPSCEKINGPAAAADKGIIGTPTTSTIAVAPKQSFCSPLTHTSSSAAC